MYLTGNTTTIGFPQLCSSVVFPHRTRLRSQWWPYCLTPPIGMVWDDYKLTNHGRNIYEQNIQVNNHLLIRNIYLNIIKIIYFCQEYQHKMIFSKTNGWDGMACLTGSLCWLCGSARQIVQGDGLSSWWQPCNAGDAQHYLVMWQGMKHYRIANSASHKCK